MMTMDWQDCPIEDLDFYDCGEEEDWSFDNDRSTLGEWFHWWEKTVESMWLSRHLAKGTSVTPLAGAMERLIGDAISCANDTYLIIEFKASKERINSEIKKFRKTNIDEYSDYLPYVQNILGNLLENENLIGNEPHALCFGYEKLLKKGGDDKYVLDIACCDYWGRDKKFQHAKRDDFTDYVFALSKVRKAPDSGTLMGSVIAVTEGGTCLLDLNDVIAAVRDKFERKLAVRTTLDYGGSSI